MTPRRFRVSCREPSTPAGTLSTQIDENKLLDTNRDFYDRLWSGASLVEPERFNTWPLIQTLTRDAPRCLEIGPGLRPRLPLQDTHFVDISPPALAALAARGGRSHTAPIGELPFPNRSFDLICALDILEHVADDAGALAELARVAAPGATVLLSVPLHPEYWTPFDDLVGHYRRYPPEQLAALLAAHGLEVAQSAVFGMKPRVSWLNRLGLWFLKHQRALALWTYNRILMPQAVRRQKPLELVPGMVDTEGVDEVFLVCRSSYAGDGAPSYGA